MSAPRWLEERKATAEAEKKSRPAGTLTWFSDQGHLLTLIEQMGEALIVEMALNGGHDEGCSCISCAALAAYEKGPTP